MRDSTRVFGLERKQVHRGDFGILSLPDRQPCSDRFDGLPQSRSIRSLCSILRSGVYIHTNNSHKPVLSWRSMYPRYSDLRIYIPSAFWLFCAEIASRFLPKHSRFVKHFNSGRFVCASWLNLYGICTRLGAYMQMKIHSQARPDQVRRIIITGQSALRRHLHRDSLRLTIDQSWWDMNTVSSVPPSSLCVWLLKTRDRRIINYMIKYNYQLPKYRYQHCSRILCSPTKARYKGGGGRAYLPYLSTYLP